MLHFFVLENRKTKKAGNQRATGNYIRACVRVRIRRVRGSCVRKIFFAKIFLQFFCVSLVSPKRMEGNFDSKISTSKTSKQTSIGNWSILTQNQTSNKFKTKLQTFISNFSLFPENSILKISLRSTFKVFKLQQKPIN